MNRTTTERLTQKALRDGRSIVAYFLGNARAWRGPVAKQIKTKLKRRL